jgi:hypothetical protein
MRILSPLRRTSISGAMFARNSEAYDSLRRIALPGLPRLEYMTGVGWVTTVEEATTNLLTAAEALELSVETTKTVTSGVSYTIKIHGGNGTITLSGAATGIIVAGSSLTVTTTSTSLVLTPAQTNSMWPTYVQLEQKVYPTQFQLPGTSRAAESLTMSTAGLSVAEGTIEGIVEITDVSKRQDGATFFRLFNIINGTGAGISIYHLATSAYWQLKTYTSGVVTSTVDIADSLTPNGFYYYKVSWTASEAAAEFWNLESQTKVALETISSPNLPTAFGSYVYLGSYNESINYLDTRFGKHRLSNIARTDDPDFDNLMPDDANTVGIFDPTPVYNHLVR